MRSTAQLRQLWAPACECELALFVFHTGAKAQVAQCTTDAWRALDMVMQRHAYAVRSNDTGGFNCRAITGGKGHSLHAFGIAVDVNWSTNPYRADNRLVTDMRPAMIDDILAITTVAAVPVFRWGGHYTRVKDAMHFEVVASPTELGAGVDWGTVRSSRPRADRPASFAVLQPGDSGPTVTRLQELLAGAGFDPGLADGVFGPRTTDAVQAYQRSRKLDVDGIVGIQTWTALLTAQPEVPAERSPVKAPRRLDPEALPTVEHGARGDVVLELQKLLAATGFDPGGVDGVFGPLTDAAVRAFQSQHGLTVDGICGRQTWAALVSAAVG